jgi:hypothetical protein
MALANVTNFYPACFLQARLERGAAARAGQASLKNASVLTSAALEPVEEWSARLAALNSSITGQRVPRPVEALIVADRLGG